MINALRAETRRLLSRRITLVALLVLLGLVALYQLQVNSLISPPSAAEMAQAQREFDEYLRDWEANHEQWEADCVESGGTAADCAQPRPEPVEWGLAPSSFQTAVSPAVTLAVYLGGLVLFVVLASFIGAEASSGALSNWLTFIPDRTTVMVSKLVVAAGSAVAVGVLLGAVTVGASVVLAAVHGQPLAGLDAVIGSAARGVVVVAVFGVLGFTVGLLTGSTGASIGVLLGGVVLTYVHLLAAFTARWAQQLSPWTPATNLSAILNDGTTYQVGTGPGSGEPGEGYVSKTVSLAQGLGYWAVVLAVLLLVTWALFRRRDVS